MEKFRVHDSADHQMKKRCPFCHAEIELPQTVDTSGFCDCGAYGAMSLLSHAHHFLTRAKKALGVPEGRTGRSVEVVDGGLAFESNGEPVIIQWAKKPDGI